MRVPDEIKRLQRLVEPPWWTFSVKSRSSEYAALQLWKSGPAAVPFIVRLLKKKEGMAAQSMLSALKHLGQEDKDALPALLLALKEYPCSPLCEAIGRLGATAQPALGTLIEILPRLDRSCQKAILLAMRGMGMATMQAYRRILRDEKLPWQLRESVAHMIESMGPDGRDATDALLKCLQDRNSKVRHAAACALSSIGMNSASDVLAGVRKSRLKRAELDAEELRKLLLVKKLHSPNVQEVVEAVHTLVSHHSAEDSTWGRLEGIFAPNPSEFDGPVEVNQSTEMLIFGLLTERNEDTRRLFVKEIVRRKESWLTPLLKHMAEDKSASEAFRYYCQEVAGLM